MNKLTFSFSAMDHMNHVASDSYNWERTLTTEQEAAEREAQEILASFSDEELIALLAEDGIIVENQEYPIKKHTFSFSVPPYGGEYNTKMPMDLADTNARSYPLAS